MINHTHHAMLWINCRGPLALLAPGSKVVLLIHLAEIGLPEGVVWIPNNNNDLFERLTQVGHFFVANVFDRAALEPIHL